MLRLIQTALAFLLLGLLTAAVAYRCTAVTVDATKFYDQSGLRDVQRAPPDSNAGYMAQRHLLALMRLAMLGDAQREARPELCVPEKGTYPLACFPPDGTDIAPMGFSADLSGEASPMADSRAEFFDISSEIQIDRAAKNVELVTVIRGKTPAASLNALSAEQQLPYLVGGLTTHFGTVEFRPTERRPDADIDPTNASSEIILFTRFPYR